MHLVAITKPWPPPGFFVGHPTGWVTVIEAFNDYRWRCLWRKLSRTVTDAQL
jgi:hypothetical protein